MVFVNPDTGVWACDLWSCFSWGVWAHATMVGVKHVTKVTCFATPCVLEVKGADLYVEAVAGKV